MAPRSREELEVNEKFARPFHLCFFPFRFPLHLPSAPTVATAVDSQGAPLLLLSLALSSLPGAQWSWGRSDGLVCPRVAPGAPRHAQRQSISRQYLVAGSRREGCQALMMPRRASTPCHWHVHPAFSVRTSMCGVRLRLERRWVLTGPPRPHAWGAARLEQRGSEWFGCRLPATAVSSDMRHVLPHCSHPGVGGRGGWGGLGEA